ncbi:MAG: AraC family transcriptional regulator [Lachnospiraceae bacterium]
MAGFSSTTQFCKTFQKKCDCSPTEFRSRYRTIKQFNKETDKNFFTLHDDD